MSESDSDSDFEIADREAGIDEPASLSVIQRGNTSLGLPSNPVEYRNQLVAKYHRGAKGLIEKIRVSGKDDADTLLISLITEMVQETDHLLGNELIATENGELRDASVISYKRVEALEKTAKAVQTKQAFEKESGFDIESPHMMVVFRYFMSKVKLSLMKINAPDEMSDVFFKSLSDAMLDWKKELKTQINELKGAK
jgi:hypothetical protein